MPNSVKYSKRKAIVDHRRQELVRLSGSRCQECHRSYESVCYDFHHITPTNKLFNLSGSNLVRSWSSIINELDKCIMLCSNCHRVIHELLKVKAANNSITLRGL